MLGTWGTQDGIHIEWFQSLQNWNGIHSYSSKSCPTSRQNMQKILFVGHKLWNGFVYERNLKSSKRAPSIQVQQIQPTPSMQSLKFLKCGNSPTPFSAHCVGVIVAWLTSMFCKTSWGRSREIRQIREDPARDPYICSLFVWSPLQDGQFYKNPGSIHADAQVGYGWTGSRFQSMVDSC